MHFRLICLPLPNSQMSQPIITTSNEPTEQDPKTHTKTLQQLKSSDQQTYHLQSINSTITIRQLRSQGLSFQLWPAAATLINFLDRHRTTSLIPPPFTTTSNHHLRLLELGSGTGVVGIAAAALFGASVTVTDLPHVVPNMEFNVVSNAGMLELNGGNVDVAALSWGDIADMEAIGREYDVVIGSDLVYHDHLYEPLLETLKYLLGEKGKGLVFLMAHLKRWKKENVFFKKAKKLFDVEALHTDVPFDGDRVGVIVYRFVRKSITASLNLESNLA